MRCREPREIGGPVHVEPQPDRGGDATVASVTHRTGSRSGSTSGEYDSLNVSVTETPPSTSATTALTADVPMSMPIVRMRSPLHRSGKQPAHESALDDNIENNQQQPRRKIVGGVDSSSSTRAFMAWLPRRSAWRISRCPP